MSESVIDGTLYNETKFTFGPSADNATMVASACWANEISFFKHYNLKNKVAYIIESFYLLRF